MTVDLFPSSLPVVQTVSGSEEGRVWWSKLPALVGALENRWSLRLGQPFAGGSCSWVAPARLSDGSPAVLKISWPHREAEHEGDALRLWSGNGAVRLYNHDRATFALLLERSIPGTELVSADEIDPKQRLLIAAEVLNELWSAPLSEGVSGDGSAVEDLGAVTSEWADLVEARMERLRPNLDSGLVAYGVQLLRELSGSTKRHVLLHGDFNPGNILASRRQPWLTIDPKPMIGDPAYDPWPLIEQIDDPFKRSSPERALTERFAIIADAVGEARDRLLAWAVARQTETALWLADDDKLPDAMAAMQKARLLTLLAEL